MNRLTKKNDKPLVGDYYSDSKDATTIDIKNKLGQLEDIEEEFGIELVTLFKLWLGKVKTIYTKVYGELTNCFEIDIYNHRIEFVLDEINIYEVTFEQYGKT